MALREISAINTFSRLQLKQVGRKPLLTFRPGFLNLLDVLDTHDALNNNGDDLLAAEQLGAQRAARTAYYILLITSAQYYAPRISRHVRTAQVPVITVSGRVTP